MSSLPVPTMSAIFPGSRNQAADRGMTEGARLPSLDVHARCTASAPIRELDTGEQLRHLRLHVLPSDS